LRELLDDAGRQASNSTGQNNRRGGQGEPQRTVAANPTQRRTRANQP
jgi:hypothetical protein